MRAAGVLLRSRFEAGDEVEAASKSTPTDPVSEADRAAERAIRSVLGDARPEDAILGEEGGETQEGAGLRWIVDPLDGTVNFLYGIPQWCVSVAVHDDDGGRGRRRSTTRCARSSSPPAAAAGAPTLDGIAVRGVRRRPTWRRALDRHRLRVRPGGADRAGRGRRAAAGAGARRAPDGQRRARSGLDGGRSLRRLLRARRAASGTSRRAACSARRPGWFPCARWRPTMRGEPGGVMAAPAELLDALAAIVE